MTVTRGELMARVASEMSEVVFQEKVRRMIVEILGKGCLHYHTHTARFSQSGFPDWFVIVPGRVWIRELKRECLCKPGRKQCTYHPSDTQRAWLDAFAAMPGFDVGADYPELGVLRPSDLLSGKIAGELAALREAGLRR